MSGLLAGLARWLGISEDEAVLLLAVCAILAGVNAGAVCGDVTGGAVTGTPARPGMAAKGPLWWG